MLISPEYLNLNQTLHEKSPTYGASGHRWAKVVEGLYDRGTVLDYGCGKGTLKAALPNLPILEYDPAIPGKERCSPCRWLVCTDVMEHIEPDCLDTVLQDMAGKTLHKAFVVIATRSANKELADGRNAHLIIEPVKWWRKKIEQHFTIERLDKNVSQKGEFVCLLGRMD